MNNNNITITISNDDGSIEKEFGEVVRCTIDYEQYGLNTVTLTNERAEEIYIELTDKKLEQLGDLVR